MSDHAAGKKWQEAQANVLLEEFRTATGRTASSMAEAERWFAGLPLVERDRVGRRLNDPGIVGRHMETPKMR
jgi:hypothetical protein